MAADRKQSATDSKSKGLQYAAFASVPLVLVLGNSMLVPILPDMAKQMKLSELQASLVITIFSVAAGLFIPITGYLSDRYKRKFIIIPSLAVYGAAGVLAGFGALWHSYPILIASRALQGLAAAGTSPIAMALVGDIYKSEASEALGLIEASNGFGKVISPILGSLLALIIWYAPFFAFPIFCAASLLAVLFLIKEPKDDKKKVPLPEYLQGIRGVFRDNGRWLLPAFASGALGLFILFGVLFYLSDTLEKAPYSIDGVAKGGLLAIPLLGLVITALLTGRSIKNNGRMMRTLMLVGLAIMTITLTGAAFSYRIMPLLIGLLTFSSVGTGLLLPCLNTLITSSVERAQRGMITSLYSSLRFFGVALGPPLFSWLGDVSVLVLFSVVVLLSASAFVLVRQLIHPADQLKQS
ncbi:MFS transporter [Paenibacillus sp. GCM10023252]|uniref:MFS transporter n=1 Tax=Paenibacillus sp. GCM10023252 TaxID=3252649 RepID=UPI0036237CB5